MKAELGRAASAILLCLGWLAAFNILGHATTVIVPTDEEMLIGARAVVRGQVTNVISAYDEKHNGIFTYITLNVSEVIKGEIQTREIVIKEPGGLLKDRASMLYGIPTFTVGEQVLLYLDTWSDGSLRVYQWFLGKFNITLDRATGKWLAARAVPTERVDIIGRSTFGTITDRADLDSYLAKVRSNVTTTKSAARTQENRFYTDVPMLARPSELTTSATATPLFTLINNNTPPRWFEPDSGQSVVFKINAAGAYNSQAIADIEAAFAAWSNVSGSSLRVINGGSTGGCGLTSLDGENTVSFNNCDNYSPFTPPAGWSCSGILASAGIVRFSTAQTKVINGITFYRGLEGNLSFNPYAACYFSSSCNVREVAVHELGHALGLGHSLDSTATMYAYAHFDNRCASLKADDENAIRFIYPGSASQPPTATAPTITTNSLASGQVNTYYAQSLAASGGVAPYSWSLVGGALPAGLTLYASGLVNGVPTTATNANFTVKVTDTAGGNAQKNITLNISAAPTPTPTPTPVPTPTPPPVPTPTPTPPPVQPARGTLTINPNPVRVCDGSGQGIATLNWSTSNVTAIQVRVGSPTGSLLASGGTSGSATTGKWVSDGMNFYLQNVSNNLPLTSANTLAVLTASVTTSGCASINATGTLSLMPVPIRVCDGSGQGVATLAWNATGVAAIEIHTGSPNGPLVTTGSANGTFITRKTVTHGTTFYLQNVSNGLPLTSANTLAVAAATVTSSGCGGPIWASQNPISVCDGSGVGVATINWSVNNASIVEVRIGSPNGPLLTRSISRGAKVTGKWVTNGLVFYLQNASRGNTTSFANTLGTVTISVNNNCP